MKMKSVTVTATWALGITLFLFIWGSDALANTFAKSTCDLAVELLKGISKDGENAILSPTSVSMVLAILQQGARGNTAEELNALLGLSAENTKTGYNNLLKTLRERTPGVVVEWGNKAYVNSDLNLDTNFKTNVEEHFQTGLEEINFSEKTSDEVAHIINSWVKESTHDLISNVITPGMVGPETIMLLVNVIYFKGNWRNRFREKNSKKGLFEKNSGDFVPATFMYQRNKYYTGRNETLGVRWVELPFQGDTYKLYFVMPTKRHTLDATMNKINGESLIHIFKYGYISNVRLRIPKFKLKQNHSLISLLQQLGLRDAFTSASDFGGISSDHLQLSEAVHEAAFEIDEKGATASGATIVAMSRTIPSSETFRLDQPFLFFITDSVNQKAIRKKLKTA